MKEEHICGWSAVVGLLIGSAFGFFYEGVRNFV